MVLKIYNNENEYTFDVPDINGGVKLFYRFEIPTNDIPDGKYNLQLLDGETVVYEDIIVIGQFKNQTIQYKRGDNIYINSPLNAKVEDVSVEITTTETVIYPNEDFDAMTSVTVDATPLYEVAYNTGNADGYESGYESGSTDGYNTGNAEGYETGFDEGYSQGNQAGYDTGYIDGETAGYDSGVEIGKEEQKNLLESITISANGTYTREDGYNEVIVEVGNEQANYGYKTNWVDEDGLRQIGWDDEDIAYFKNNALHYEWENEKYIVSDANKALYNVLTKDNIATYVDNPDLVFMPKLPLLSQITSWLNFKYLKGIPKFELYPNSYWFFENNSSLETVPILDFSNITTISNLYGGCNSIKSIPLQDFSQVINAYGAFRHCYSLNTIPKFDLGSCNNVGGLFNGSYSLEYVPDLNIKNAENTSQMFLNCYALKTIELMDFGNVLDAGSMFSGCKNLIKLPYLNLKKSTNLKTLLNNCENLTEIDGIDTDSATDVTQMFFGCSSLTKIPQMNFSNVTKLGTFFGYGNLTKITECGGFVGLKSNWTDGTGLAKLPNLTYESCINILNGLADVTELGGRTLKVHSNFLTAVGDEISIGTSKGWTISA